MSGIPSWARVGAKVVCLRDGRSPAFRGVRIRVGAILTIRSVFRHPCEPDLVGLLFREVRNAIHPRFGAERGYRLDRFRPLVPPRSEADDIALFTSLLERKRVDA